MNRPRDDSPLLVALIALALLLTLIAHAGPGIEQVLTRRHESFADGARDMPRIVIVEPDPVV